MTKLLASGLCVLLMAAQAGAQTATVELVAGAAATTGTAGNTLGFLKELDRLVPGTRIHLGNEARVVLIQTARVPGAPPGGSKLCISWTIIGGVERFTVRNIRLTSKGDCPVSPANVRMPDASTALPFVRHVTFVDFAHDKADLPEPAMLTRLRAATDSMRIVGTAPDRDLSISFTLAGEPPDPVFVAGAAANTSRSFYPCVRLQFALFDRTADDRLVRVSTMIVTLRRIRAHENRKYQQHMTTGVAVTLESVSVCQ